MKLRLKSALLALGFAAALLLGACGDDEDPTVSAPDPTTSTTDEGIDEFATLDGNGDSFLDGDEVAEWVDDVGTFDEWDIDRDSELDYDEIANNAFENWDADGNGTLSQTEWKNGVDFWYPAAQDPTVFNDWDNDGDSELDADEFAESFDVSVAGESWNIDTFNEETFKTAYFDLYDADGDGKVSESEFDSGSSLFGTPRD